MFGEGKETRLARKEAEYAELVRLTQNYPPNSWNADKMIELAGDIGALRQLCREET